MFSRALALMIVPALPFLPLMLPLGPAHSLNAVIAGSVAFALALFSLADDRARFGVAAVGGWVALSAFIFQSTMLEEIVAVSWGVTTFALIAGPFSARPTFFKTPVARPIEPPAADQDLRPAQDLPLAA